MAKGMHMVIGLSSLNTRKRKLKITKQRMSELVEEHRFCLLYTSDAADE